MTDPKNCPCCKSPATVWVTDEGTPQEENQIKCDNASCGVQTPWGKPQDVTKTWNHRP